MIATKCTATGWNGLQCDSEAKVNHLLCAYHWQALLDERARERKRTYEEVAGIIAFSGLIYSMFGSYGSKTSEFLLGAGGWAALILFGYLVGKAGSK